mmetsp:Transcript_23010/g.51791  ORF Transcript_23010/g.51791 Transcript_23010/m.51791 type:complete len:306 (-) Transcript_23010:92-1009(-)
MSIISLPLLQRDPGSRTQSDSKGSRHSPAPETTLLPSSTDDRLDPDTRTATDVKCPDSLGAVNLVARDGSKVKVPLVNVDVDLSCRLRDVGVEEHLVLSADLPDLHHRLNHSDLIIHRHDRHKRRIRPDCRSQRVKVDQAVGLHREVCDLEPLVLQHTARIEHALVLRLRCDDVLLLGSVEASNPFDRHVVALRGAAGEDDFLGLRSDQLGNMSSGLFHQLFYFPAIMVGATVRVAVLPGQQRHHSIQYAGIQCGRTLVVKECRPSFLCLPRDAEVHLRVRARDFQPSSSFFGSLSCAPPTDHGG